MYHSIIVSGRDLYREWGLIPTSRPVINPPEVKTTYVDLPASDGGLDYTDIMLGRPPYGYRKGSWEFAVKSRRGGTGRWQETFSAVMNYLHGVQHTIVLEDDPDFYYTGRLNVNSWKSDKNHSTITIDYCLEPFRKSLKESDEEDWLWDDLFTKTIRYGTFRVEGQKYRNLLYAGIRPTTPVFNCSAEMTVDYNGSSYGLVSGENVNSNLALHQGDNIMLFHGDGIVTVKYREVSL
jgi:hypothetical protein